MTDSDTAWWDEKQPPRIAVVPLKESKSKSGQIVNASISAAPGAAGTGYVREDLARPVAEAVRALSNAGFWDQDGDYKKQVQLWDALDAALDAYEKATA